MLTACAPQKYPPPGWWGLKSRKEEPQLHFDQSVESVELKAGKTKALGVTLITKKRYPGMITYKIWRVKKAEGSCVGKWARFKGTLPMPDGLDVSIEPSTFLAQPNKIYHSTITIKASPELPQGKYVFCFQTNIENAYTSGSWITVNIVA